jgi:hypothetical protein
MAEFTFNERDLDQIKTRGMSPERVISQTKAFNKGFPYIKLLRPCTVGDGITVLHHQDLVALNETLSQAASAGRAMKFVPASGAASRMFKLLLSFNNRYAHIHEKEIRAKAEKNDPDHAAFLEFIKGIKKFAFYEDLKRAMSRDGLDVEGDISKGHYKNTLEYLLTPKGLDLAHLPKGLIEFHAYPESTRTPFEEQLAEAAEYTMDSSGVVRVHFTVSPEDEKRVKDHVKKILSRYEGSGIRYEVGFSTQMASTDTIAVDMENRPFRDRDGRLVFRPGGHGALLENLNGLGGDLVFIKNIDNVVPDRLRPQTIFYKKALGGYLITLQNEIFGSLERLTRKEVDGQCIKEALQFTREKLCLVPPEGTERSAREEKIDTLISLLHRPLRVCGMVRNEGEPGGGPFWVGYRDKGISLQIVESSQVDLRSPEQRAIWEASTHFNPVDLVCGVRDHLGRPFDLMKFRDPSTGFISVKSKEDRELKALELPGLWNGAMAHWNSVFVEIPTITFNPVKTVHDLLRKEHQA